MLHEKEKGDASTSPLSRDPRLEDRKKLYDKIVGNTDDRCQVDFFDKKGVVFRQYQYSPGFKGDLSKRGVITEWSKSSRKRMREFMITHKAPDGWFNVGVTLTVPGPPLSVAETKQVWDIFRKSLTRFEIGFVWRLEVQKRGSVHWHLMCITPYMYKVKFKDYEGGLLFNSFITEKWIAAVDSLGVCNYDCHIETKTKIITKQTGLRSTFSGAQLHMVDCQLDKGTGSWMRYMQDHCSKTKQEQLPVGFGRHWGVVGKDFFVSCIADSTEAVERKVYIRMLRQYRRLITPHVKPRKQYPGMCFEKRLGFTPSVGGKGKSVRFGNPETVKKLLNDAKSYYASLHDFNR